MKSVPSTEERVWAVLSHLSALAFGMGILIPIIAWSEQRRKSNYATFQSLQALGYQSLGYTAWILAAFIIIVIHSLFTVRELVLAGQSGADPASFLGPVMGLHFVVMLGLIGLYALLPFAAAIACALGRDFRYPIMGHRLARYLNFEPAGPGNEQGWLLEDHEDRWVVSMGHFSVIIALWGMLAPLTAWILQGKRSLFLKFQSIQTFTFQIGTMLLYVVAGAVYMLGFFALLFTVGLDAGAAFDNSGGMIGLVIFFVSMLIAVFILLAVPMFHIMGQWAGYRVLKGDNYHYPLIGRLVEKRIQGKANSVIEEKVV